MNSLPANMWNKVISIFLVLLLFVMHSCSPPKKVSKNLDTMIHGYVAPGFEEVKDEFIKNFTERGDWGAACAIYYKGEKVVDLWGGFADPLKKELWEENTMVMVFSTTKGLAAATLAMAHSNGWLDYDEKVSTYWPEFAQNGKENITVRTLLAHEAGLCLVDTKFKIDFLTEFDSLASIMARQKPIWEPGTKHGYHLTTMGMYMNELMRRTDPKGRSIGQFFSEEIAQPYDLNFYIGLPDSIPEERVAKTMFPKIGDVFKEPDGFPNATKKMLFDKKSLLAQSFKVPKNFSPNKDVTRSVEMPSGNGIGDARSIAFVYGLLAQDGNELGLTKETMAELTSPATLPPAGPLDEVMEINTYFSLGFLKPGPKVGFGTSRSAFGTPGAGGSFGFADPDKELGFAYVMSRMGVYLKDDNREQALRDAAYKCIKLIEMEENKKVIH